MKIQRLNQSESRWVDLAELPEGERAIVLVHTDGTEFKVTEVIDGGFTVSARHDYMVVRPAAANVIRINKEPAS